MFPVSNGSQDATCTNHDDELRIREAIGGREVLGSNFWIGIAGRFYFMIFELGDRNWVVPLPSNSGK